MSNDLSYKITKVYAPLIFVALIFVGLAIVGFTSAAPHADMFETNSGYSVQYIGRNVNISKGGNTLSLIFPSTDKAYEAYGDYKRDDNKASSTYNLIMDSTNCETYDIGSETFDVNVIFK